MSATTDSAGKRKLALTIGALGVVFGDIGTSPLYALKECLHHRTDTAAVTTLGILSLILWSLIVVVSIKYITLVLRADNHGEGGILALLNLAFPANLSAIAPTKAVLLMGAVGVFGAALLYGDGVITPAISVVSAVEGLKVFSPALDSIVLPVSVCILVGLFSVQRFGTDVIGKAFGPIIMFWFLVIGALGAIEVVRHPVVLQAFYPVYGFEYLAHYPGEAMVVLGSVMLAVTGAETMYADMGHFGRIPIRTAWNYLVMPALMLNYLGQGALVLSSAAPEKIDNPFFMLAPEWGRLPLVLLATVASVIASQGIISGAFSLTTAAIQMGYLPRLQISHTSDETSGRIYVPLINFLLAVACILLVLSFRTSSALAAAYGIAVTMTMMATTCLFFIVTQRKWGWSRPLAIAVCSVFAIIELAFFASNVLKIPHGGWLPLCIGALVFYLMTTWKMGRTYIRTHIGDALTLPCFVDSIAMSGVLDASLSPHRVKGTAIFLASTSDITPHSLSYNLTHNHILHDRNIILTISPARVPVVPDEEKLAIVELPEGFYQFNARFGFMEVPTIQDVVAQAAKKGMEIDIERSTFFLGRETLVRTNKGLPRWRESAFILMSKNAQNAAQFFRLPSSRTIEIGKQVEI
ncbi:MAG: potassium transporter Kup [Chthoniobacterales bacterium]